MKITGKILIGLLALALIALVFSNFVIKKEFEKIDKTDFYWNFEKISNQHFSHIKIDSGNIAEIVIEQSDSFAVKVWKHLSDYNNITYRSDISNDTLFLGISSSESRSKAERQFKYFKAIRVFTPRLISFSGHNANVEFVKMNQPSIEMMLSGVSVINYETNLLTLKNLKISAVDSTQVSIHPNPEMRVDGIFNVNYLKAKVEGNSSLQLSGGLIDSLDYQLTDSASIFLSGRTLSKIKK